MSTDLVGANEALMKHNISWEDNGAFVTFEGTITSEGLVKYQAELHKNERYDELRHVILDYRKAQVSERAEEEQEIPLANAIGASYSLKALKVAIVATENEMIENAEYRIAKLKEFGVGWDMKIFATPPGARSWIEASNSWR